MKKSFLPYLLLSIFIIIGFYSRLYKFNYGLPGFYVSDTQTISEAMDMGNALLQRNWNFFAEPAKYPLVTPYLFLFANGIVFGIASVLSSLADVLRFLALHQETPFLIARFLSILAGTAIIPLAFFTARLLAKRFGSAKPEFAAVISAFFATFSLLLFQFSRMERAHIFLGFFTLLSYFLYLRFIERPSKKNGLWLGMAVGLAAGTLQNGVLTALFLILPLAFFLFEKRKFSDCRPICYAFLSAAVLFFLSYPYLFLSPSETLGLGSGFDISFSGSQHNAESFSGQGFYAIVRNFSVYDPAIFILMIISIIFLCSAKRRFVNFLKADALGISAYSISFLLLFGLYSVTTPRFIVTLVLLMIILSGVAVSEFVLRSRLGIIIFSLLCLFAFAQVLQMTLLLRSPDTRDLATQWVRKYLTEKDIILIDNQNIAAPITKESILRGVELGSPLTRRDQLLLSLVDEDYPKDARNILRGWQFNISEYGEYGEFIKENNITHIIVSDNKGFRSASNSLSAFAMENFELKEVFSPFRRQSDLLSSDFPDEFSNPIIDLWGIARMGPEVRIYEKP